MKTFFQRYFQSPLRRIDSVFQRGIRLSSLVVFGMILMTGCGGGGSSGGNVGSSTGTPVTTTPTPTVATPQLPATGTAVALTSATDNPFALGNSFNYIQATALISVVQTNNVIQIEVQGEERWRGFLALGKDQSALKVGDYPDLGDTQDSSLPGSFSWKPATPITACGGSRSNVMIDRIVFDGSALTELSLRFEQNCMPGKGLLKGAVRWLASDVTKAPGPIQTIPTTMWAPAAGVTPATGNYVYVESASGDPVGGGKTYLHTQADSLISTILGGPHMKFVVKGDINWFVDFQAMDSLSKVQPGYYPDLRDYTFRNPRKGGLVMHTGITSCENKSRGWVAVDRVQYQGDVLIQIDFRFEQRCLDGVSPPLRGKIHWSNDDQTLPAVPRQIPSGLWQARSPSIPTNGNFVYLEGESGEWVSSGQTLLYSQTQSPLRVYLDQYGNLLVQIGENEWSGVFTGSYSQPRLETGFYSDLQAPIRNPAKGSFSWNGQGRACDGTGWFAVDDVAYTYGELRYIDLRFEQICKGSNKRLNGRVRWASSDPVVLENRIDPPLPRQTVPPLTVPVNGNYVQLSSGSDDYIGGGRDYLYTSSSAEIKVDANSGFVTIAVNGDERWRGQFGALGKFETVPSPGTYTLDKTNRVSDWSGEARGCNNVQGSFMIDRLDRTANGVQALDMSFEQYCDGAYTPLRGRIHWVANDSIQPPGPVYPVPTDLWRLPPSQIPTSGNYLFLHSAPGNFVGFGKNQLFTSASQEFRVRTTDNGVTVDNGSNQWILELKPMLPLIRLQPGYYGQVKQVGTNMNPARGGLSFSSDGRGCNSSIGWFVVDSVAYEGLAISALDLRFLQLCEESGPPLYGQLRWRR